ncbi:hypothetical protein UP10_06610 [Bradyrhizobium sp. LTSPM299]|nr:hypothetical protein UP10_06610 [Bradyrhizobium sp. LTSPM299]
MPVIHAASQQAKSIVELRLKRARCAGMEDHMAEKFNHAANDSPRSGGSKTTGPVVWGVIVAAIIATALWLVLHA